VRITTLAGGVGAARFLRGLQAHLRDAYPDETRPEITVIGNTADDITLFGLRVCPDLDTVMYTLGGAVHEQQGWGRADETFVVQDELRGYDVPPDWFRLGDKDLATHIVRTQMLRSGWSLTDVTAALCERWQPGIRLLPMSDDPVETHVVIDDGAQRAVHFQEWWVRMHAAVPAHSFVFLGAEEAEPGPAVVAAIHHADVIVLPPSNPVVSIGAILQVPGVREAIISAPAPVVGVSPIVGGAPVRGMADACLAVIGVQTSASAVAAHYGARADGGLLDGWLVSESDDGAGIPEPIATLRRPLLMTDVTASAAMAGAALGLALELRAS